MKRLGEILLDWGMIAVSELHTALEACRRSGGRLGTQLLKFGFVDEISLLEALSEQYGVQSVTGRALRRAPIQTRSLLPPRVARRLQAVPFGTSREFLKVAMTNPRHPAALEEIAEITEYQIEPYVATESAVFEVIDELESSQMEIVVEPMSVDPFEQASQVSSFEWEQMWAPAQPHPDRLLRMSRRPARLNAAPLVATFPGLAPVTTGVEGDPEHEIEEVTFRDRLCNVRHRDQIGSLLLRYSGNFFARVCLFAVHRGEVIGWMGRGHGVVAEDLQSLSIPLDRPSMFRDLRSDADRYIGEILPGDHNEALARAMGEPKPESVMLLPIKVAKRTVAYLIGDNPGDSTVAVPLDELVSATAKAGAAFEILIMKKKILS
jgi:hypothetical protein